MGVGAATLLHHSNLNALLSLFPVPQKEVAVEATGILKVVNGIA